MEPYPDSDGEQAAEQDYLVRITQEFAAEIPVTAISRDHAREVARSYPLAWRTLAWAPVGDKPVIGEAVPAEVPA